MNKNFFKLWFSDATYAAASALSTGSVFSAFLIHNGITEGQVGFYLAVTQFVNLTISILLAGMSAGVRDTRKPLVLLTMISGLLNVFHITFCVTQLNGVLTFTLILILGCFQATITALRTIFLYKLPCEVIDLHYYSVYAGFQSLFTGVAGIGIGFLLPLFFDQYSFLTVCGWAFALASVMLVFSALGYSLLKPLEKPTQDKAIMEHSNNRQWILDDLRLLVKNNTFIQLLLPNIIRGFGDAMIGIYSVLVIQRGLLYEGNVSLITAAMNIGTLLSCFVYVFCVKHFGISKTCMGGGILFCVICLTFTGNSAACVVLFSISYIGYNMVCCAIPNFIYQSISSKLISIFQVWRLALSQLGLVLASVLYSTLIETVDSFWIVFMGAIAYLFCSTSYYRYFKKRDL